MKYLLLHGLGQNVSSWDDIKTVTGNSSDILIPNLAAWIQGKSPNYADLYKEFCRYCDGIDEPLNICGLSLGGILALHYGMENTAKVNSLVLIGTQYVMPKRMLQFQNMIFRIMPNKMFQDVGIGKSEFISLCKSMMDINLEEGLKKVECRTLIVCGEKDKANIKASMQLAEKMPTAEMKIVPGAGHEVNLDAPEVLGEMLKSFWS